jgi:type I restriction enzyme S subunit
MIGNCPNKKLRDLAEIRVSNVDKKVHASEKPVKLCNYMDVYSNEYVTSSLPFMEASATAAELERFGLKKGDVIITKDSETPDDIGKAAVVMERISNLVCGYHLALIRPITDELDSVYLAKQLSTARVARYFALHASGSTRYGLPTSAIEAVEIPTPPKPEQIKITEILSTVDRAIEQTEALITKQQRIKTGLMQDLLTRGIDEHGNLRSEKTHQFKDSPLGRIPVEWEVKKLIDIATYQNGKAFPSYNYGTSGVRLVRPGNLAPNGWVTWDAKHTTYLPKSYWNKSREYQVGAGEILMNLTAQSLEDQFLGRVCITPDGNECLLNQRIARIKPHSCKRDYLYWALKGPQFREYIDSIPQGTKVQHLYNRNLDAIRLAFPECSTEQRSIAEGLWEIENNSQASIEFFNKLKALKTALMQDLLTGKKRVTKLLSDTKALKHNDPNR